MELVDGSDIEALLKVSGLGPRALIAAATRAVVQRLGDRGSCILVGADPRVILATDFPSLSDLPVDLRRYPEIATAVASREVVLIEDVNASSVLRPVADLLPPCLGAIAVIPLVTEERCLGAIVARSARPRPMAARDVEAARIDAVLVATLLAVQYGEDLLQRLGVDHPAARPAPEAPGSGSLSVVPRSTGVVQGSTAPVPPSRPRVLIGDDEVADAALLAESLTEEGFDVMCVADGAEVVRQARHLPPDLILMDVHMPILDGFSAAAELATDPRASAVPILFLSGSDDLLARVRSFDREGIDFLRKPCSFLELVARIEKALKQAESRKHLRLDANIDELTGLGNLRCLREHFEKEESRMGRTGSSLAIVMLDVDKLKQINDQRGHLVGSRVLKAIGETLRSEIRPTDLAVRYGGDEFVVLLPHAALDEGVAFANRVLARLNGLRTDGVCISVSVGVAAVHGTGGGRTADAALARADAAAYRAKRKGGNRVCKQESESESDISTSAETGGARALADLPAGA